MIAKVDEGLHSQQHAVNHANLFVIAKAESG